MTLRVALAQIDATVGDISGNRELILGAAAEARDRLGAHLVVTPELALTGYPPEDLVLRPGFMERTQAVVAEVVERVSGIDLIFGHPWREDQRLYNSATWARAGAVLGRYHKRCLPNYAIFDEKRYFTPGEESLVVECGGVRVGLVICEDIWEREPAAEARRAGAEVLVIPNASPYRRGKGEHRLLTLRERVVSTGLPIAYCNLVGGQDELLFDGRSLVMDGDGGATVGPHCAEAVLGADFDGAAGAWQAVDWPAADTDEEGRVYAALRLGFADYLAKNGFDRVVMGLSGGIDSALCLALAVDVLGPGGVIPVLLPSAHTSALSLELGREQCQLLGVEPLEIGIDAIHAACRHALDDQIGIPDHGLADQNLQARSRGVLLMAISNQTGAMLVATGNKSELAVGYCTIYGDMCGGFAPLKDVSKTLVYRLAAWRNRQSAAIPQGVLERPPSAELAPDQTDQDTLPPYDELDAIVERYVERDWSIAEIVADGYAEATVRQVAGLVLANEYKRRQGAPGIRITGRAFGRDRRYPITSGWRESGEAM